MIGNAPATARRKPLSHIVLFALAVLAAGWLGRLLDEVSGAGDDAGVGQLVWIAAPIGMAAVLRYRSAGGWGDAGLRPRFRGNVGWHTLSSPGVDRLIVIGLTAAGVATVAAVAQRSGTGGGAVQAPETFNRRLERR